MIELFLASIGVKIMQKPKGLCSLSPLSPLKVIIQGCARCYMNCAAHIQQLKTSSQTAI